MFVHAKSCFYKQNSNLQSSVIIIIHLHLQFFENFIHLYVKFNHFHPQFPSLIPFSLTLEFVFSTSPPPSFMSAFGLLAVNSS